MTTTVTTGLALGTGGLAAGAGALALAGAAGLGLLGLAKLSSRGNSGGRGNRGGRKGGHRHRRSASEESDALRSALDLIRMEDFTGCGLRLMCELASDNHEDLAEEELAILNLVGPTVKPGEGLLPGGGLGDYTLAKSLGEAKADCGLAYPMCALNGTQLMHTVMRLLP